MLHSQRLLLRPLAEELFQENPTGTPVAIFSYFFPILAQEILEYASGGRQPVVFVEKLRHIAIGRFDVRLYDAILDAEYHTEQETANFLLLGIDQALSKNDKPCSRTQVAVAQRCPVHA